MDHSAETINAFQQLGCGKLCYMRLLDAADVLALAGVEIGPTETACALIDADGSPHLIRGSAAACLIEAHDRGLVVAWVH